MQFAILAVLILIAVILAPWLIGVAAALAAAYGVYVVVLAALAIIATPIIIAWAVMTQRRPATEPPPIIGNRVVCRHCQSEMPDNIAFCQNCRSKM